MEGSDDARALRTARNQALFRSVNQKVNEINEAFEALVDGTEYVCECANADCVEQIRLTADEYAAIRLIPTHFFVRPHHVFPEFERVVDDRDGYVVVEKFGEAGAEAVALAPETVDTEEQRA
jgi:hypothetical protein